MKNFIFIFTSLFILAACGTQEEQGNTEPTNDNQGQQEENQIESDSDIIEEDDETIITPSPTATEKASIEDKIVVDEPLPNANVSSPLTVSGEAIGPWFFEASFPVTLLDNEDNVLAQGAATADGEWMTEEMVPFEAELTFDPKEATSGTLVLEKDNPSGEPDKSEKLEIPVSF